MCQVTITMLISKDNKCPKSGAAYFILHSHLYPSSPLPTKIKFVPSMFFCFKNQRIEYAVAS
jgi:hypothetical protein